MTEEEKIFAGQVYCPGHPDLVAIKLRAHNLCSAYNQTFENEKEKRADIVRQLFADFGEGSFVQGPIQIHYGTHTHIGAKFFGNFNLTIQDDAPVTIGDRCNFGPNVTIVTPQHPLLPDERRALKLKDGGEKRVCYAEPVKIGNDCWFGANVVVCPGVTIGDNCVIGAGSVVTKDIPSNSIAVGNPCRVLRAISEADSMKHKPERLGDEEFDFDRVTRQGAAGSCPVFAGGRMFIPENWQDKLCLCAADSEGLSPAEVTRAVWNGQTVFVKSIGEAFSDTTYSVRREAEMMRWLNGKLSVPAVLDTGCENGREYLVMSELRGRHIDDLQNDPEAYIRHLAGAVKALRRVEIDGCPFDSKVDLRLRELRDLLDRGLADIDPSHWEPETGFDSPEALYRWLCEHKPQEELVFSHGDLAANFFVDGDTYRFYDLARAGVADRMLDVAFCVRSIRDIDRDGTLEARFYELLGEAPDREKINYYILLDEMF